MIYHNCCEEHKYLAGIRREKESFERLIKERGVCCVFFMFFLADAYFGHTVHAITDLGRGEDAVIKTISSCIAGGRRELSSEPSRVCLSCNHQKLSQRIVSPRSLTFENSARRCHPSCMRQNCLLSPQPSLLATTSSLLIFVWKERASLIWCRVSIADDCKLWFSSWLSSNLVDPPALPSVNSFLYTTSSLSCQLNSRTTRRSPSR
jgi:hypothetical protein